MMAPGPGRTPSPALPLRYAVTAVAAFVLAAAGVPWLAPELAGHYYHPRVLALTHVVTLGWITLTIMGASYQLIPIVLERPVWSERLARWQFALFIVGVVGVVGHFFLGAWSGLVWAAALVGVAVAMHLVNAALSVRGVARWTFTARLVVLALAGLGFTALFGLALGVDKVARFLPGALLANLHAHVHLAILGWVLPMVIGVAARVYPMFLLAREPGGWPGHVQLLGLALGVPAVVVGVLAQAPAITGPGAAAVAAAVAAHLVWIAGMARSRKRPALDWGLRFALAGAAYLVPSMVLGLGFALDLISGPRLGLAYAVLVLGGWVSLTIAGMLLKIVPFLVWYRAYGPHVGRRAVPTLAQLGWPAAEAVAFALMVPGMAALAVAVAAGEAAWIRLAGLVVAAGAVAFAVVVGGALQHLVPGRVDQLPAPAAPGRAS
jgi:hypothetical protein